MRGDDALLPRRVIVPGQHDTGPRALQEMSHESQAQLHVALVEPEIPQNTGNIARLCAATRCPLHLVGEIGFRLDAARLRRAALDYWPLVDLRCHDTLDAFEEQAEGRLWLFTKHATRSYTAAQYQPGDFLVFGSEGHGLPTEFRERHAERTVRIPMAEPRVRSLNLATAVGIGLYEALRQLGRV